MVSSSVTATCNHSGPWGVPRTLHRQIVWMIPQCWPKKNGSASPSRTEASQPPTITTNTATCRIRSSRPRRRSRSSASSSSPTSAEEVTSGVWAFGRTLIGCHDLAAQVVPDLLVEPREPGVEANLRDVPWTRQVDLVRALDRRRGRREHQHPVCERDRLLEIVCDEDHRSRGLRPEVQELVLH